MTDDEINECIDGLLDVTSGGVAMFHAAASDVRSEEARALLLDRAQRFGRAAAALRSLAAKRGLVESAHARTAAGANRTADEESILGECERREEGVIVAYRDALECALPAAVRGVVAEEFERLLASLGTLRAARERTARQHHQVVGRPM